MKQLHVLGVMLAVLVARLSVAGEDVSVVLEGEGNAPLNAVVKLEVTTAKPDIYCPWITRTGGGTGSGVVIDTGRILTCAHCVTDACYIRVRKHNEDRLYHGSVQFVDNDADLALVGVDDPAFMAGITPMEIGETPHVQDDVLAVGYPRAINPGNSGGPVLDMKSGKVAGVAFQGLGKEEGEPLGYIIPPMRLLSASCFRKIAC